MRCQGTGHIPLRLNGRGASVERFSQDTLLHALKNKNPILFFFVFYWWSLMDWSGDTFWYNTYARWFRTCQGIRSFKYIKRDARTKRDSV